MKNKFHRARATFAALCAAFGTCAALAAPAAPRYQLTDLGGSMVRGINNNGQVVGESPDYQLAIWKDGVWTPLHKLPGDGEVDYQFLRINDAGDVAGAEFVGLTFPKPTHAVVWPAGGGAPVQLLHDRRVASTANDIANDGSVIGFASQATSPGRNAHGFAWDGGALHVLPATPWNSPVTPMAINDRHEVAGYSTVGDQIHLVRHADGAWQDLGTMGGDTVVPTGMNLRGQIVGWASTATSPWPHAFVWSDGAFVDLGTFGGIESFADAINRSGTVVGSASLPSGDDAAFVAPPGGAMIDLRRLVDGAEGWTFMAAYDINDAGAIVGQGMLHGLPHCFLLTPIGR